MTQQKLFQVYVFLLYLSFHHLATTNRIGNYVVSYKGYRVYKVSEKGFRAPKLDIPNTKFRPSVLSEHFEYDTGDIPYTVRSYLIPKELDSYFRRTLEHAGAQYIISSDDLQREIEEERIGNKNPETGSSVTQKYFSYNEICDFLKEIKNYINIETGQPIAIVDPIGKSFEGREIYLVRISSDHDAEKPIIFMEAGIHAREWTAISAALYTIHQLVVNYTYTIPNLNDIDYYIIPLSNPDGYEFSRSKNRLWRKTRSFRNGHYGVDGNRNFGFHWGEAGTSSNPTSEIYKGPHPFSELETQHIRDAGEKYKDRIHVFVSVHAFGPCILYPWGYKITKPAPQSGIMNDIAREASDVMKRYGGSQYTYGTSSILMYEAAGGSDDYFKGGLGIDLSFTFELSSANKSSFVIPTSKIHGIASEAFEGFKVIAKKAAKYEKLYIPEERKRSDTTIWGLVGGPILSKTLSNCIVSPRSLVAISIPNGYDCIMTSKGSRIVQTLINAVVNLLINHLRPCGVMSTRLWFGSVKKLCKSYVIY